MSAPPPEQPVYYSPAPAPVAPEGTPNYQYVTPQQTGVPAFQYQPSPDQVQQQPYYAAQSPQVQQAYPQSPIVQQQQQPIYNAQQQQPIYNEQQQQPIYNDQQQQQQQAYFAQPQQQAQPTAIIYTQQQIPTDTPVIAGDGQGLTGKFPQVGECCLCLPLHTGALVIAALMTIFYGYCGLVLFIDGSYAGVYFIIIGILYLLVAVVSAYGFVGIYKEEPMWVDRFIRMYVVGSIAWLVLYIIQIIIYAVDFDGFGIGGLIAELIIGGFFQFYFCVCLVSYQRVLHARVGSSEKQQIPMQIAV